MLSFSLGFFPMEINVLPEAGRKDTDAPAGFDLAAVIADVVDSGLRVPGKPMRAGGVGTVIKTRRGNRHRKLIQAAAFFIQLVTEVNDVLTLRVVDSDRCEGLG